MAQDKNSKGNKGKSPADASEAVEKGLEASEQSAPAGGGRIEQAPAETVSALHMPKPKFIGVWPVKDLPDAEKAAALNLNVRSINKLPGETDRAAVDRENSIPEMMDTLINSSEDEQLHPSNALTIAVFPKGAPKWLPADVLTDQNAALIGGNRRTIAMKRLHELYGVKGLPVNLIATDDEGNEVITKVIKKFDKFAVTVYENPTEEQFRHLQRKEFDRKGLKRGDILRNSINIFRKDISQSEDVFLSKIGKTVFAEFYYSANDPENRFKTGVQIARKCAKLPPDIGEAVCAKYNKVPDVWHLNDKQLRPLLASYEAEVGEWKGKSFITETAKVRDARIRPSLTTDQLAELFDKIAVEDPTMLGGPEKGARGRDRSAFLNKVFEFRGKKSDGTRVVAAATMKDLQKLEPGVQDSVTTKHLLNALIGKTDSIEVGQILDLDREFQLKAVELMEKHDMAWYDAWVGKLNKLLRARNAEIAAAKAAQEAKAKPATPPAAAQATPAVQVVPTAAAGSTPTPQVAPAPAAPQPGAPAA